MNDVLSLIHPAWIKKHQLDKHVGEVLSLPAKDLLSPRRFDLFSKLYYIQNRDSRPYLAKRVYYESLRSIIPYGKEWGKENEKSSFSNNREAFDALIEDFANGVFDPSVSIVPVGKDNDLIDGAHRVSTLAFYGKEVEVCRFKDVEVDKFPYTFFLDRWISRYVADLTAYEGVRWLVGTNILIQWAGNQDVPLDVDSVLYRRRLSVTEREFSRLLSLMGLPEASLDTDHEVVFSFFVPYKDLEISQEQGVLLIDGQDSVEKAAWLVLTWEGKIKWYKCGRFSCRVASVVDRMFDRVAADAGHWWFKAREWFKSHLTMPENKLWVRFYRAISPLWKKTHQ